MAAATSSDLRSFLPKTVEFATDRGKGVSAHRRGGRAKIAFLNEYARDLVVCLTVPGKLLLLQAFDLRLRWFVCYLGAAQPFFSC